MIVERSKVSVIVPVYNVEEYLPECIDSILGQRFDRFELILVDDGATDGSGAICDSYAAKDSRIRVLHKENGGLSSARNAGIEVASGKYIAFIDSDDVVHKDYLRDMVAIAERENADLVACSFFKGEECVWQHTDEARVEALDIRIGREILNKMNENDVVVTVAWNKLYHSKFFKEYALRYPEGKIHEDMFLTPQVLYHADKMIITSRRLYFYRQRPNSIMSAAFSLKQLQVLESIEFRISFFQETGFPELMTREYESYIRKIIQMHEKMHMEHSNQYEIHMKQLKKKAGEILKDKTVFSKLSIKYKIKLLLFIL